MSDASTRHLIEMYMEEAEAPMFLSGFFRSPPQNFHSSEMIEIDIERDEEEIAIVVTDLTTGGRLNESNLYTNKGFTPPVFDEKGPISAYSLIKREPGRSPFLEPEFGAHATRQAFRIFRKLEKKIRRSIELMSSQVLQTGALTLIDKSGTALYELDFQAKATHLPTVSVAWGTEVSGERTDDPLGDVASLAQVVRRDGKRKPNRLVFGTQAYRHFISHPAVLKALDNRSMALGSIAPETRGEGATFMGWVWIGHYRFEMWTYDGFYKHPQTGALTDYVDEDNVIMLSDGARLDLSYGAIPMIGDRDPRALPFLPPRMSSSDRGLDLTTNAWISEDNKQLMVSAGTRPLTIPTAIDTFGCLTTTV